MSLVLQLDCHWHCQHVEFHLQSCSVQILVSAVGAAWPHPNLSLLGLFFGEQKCKSPLAAQDNKKNQSNSSTPVNCFFSTELFSEIWVMNNTQTLPCLPAFQCLPEDSDGLGSSFTVYSPCKNMPAVPASTLSLSHLHPKRGRPDPHGAALSSRVWAAPHPLLSPGSEKDLPGTRPVRALHSHGAMRDLMEQRLWCQDAAGSMKKDVEWAPVMKSGGRAQRQLLLQGHCLVACMVSAWSLTELFLLGGENDVVSQIFLQLIPSQLQVLKVLLL